MREREQHVLLLSVSSDTVVQNLIVCKCFVNTWQLENVSFLMLSSAAYGINIYQSPPSLPLVKVS